MIYLIKDGKYSGDNMLSPVWGAALKAIEIQFVMTDFSEEAE